MAAVPAASCKEERRAYDLICAARAIASPAATAVEIDAFAFAMLKERRKRFGQQW